MKEDRNVLPSCVFCCINVKLIHRGSSHLENCEEKKTVAIGTQQAGFVESSSHLHFCFLSPLRGELPGFSGGRGLVIDC